MLSNENSGATAMPRRDHEWLNTAQAAHLLGVCKRTLDAWRKKGIGPTYHRFGPTRIWYLLSDILAYIASMRRG